jgi:hypothetical protein
MYEANRQLGGINLHVLSANQQHHNAADKKSDPILTHGWMK